jgi:HlyD family secretion protein
MIAAGVLILLALGGWAASRSFTEPSGILSRTIAYFRGPTLPAGFASGNGRLEATEYDVASKRAGRLAEVLVAEGALVEPRQVVARMDTADLDADLRQAQAQLVQAREDKRRALATVAQRQGELRTAVAAITQRESDLERAEAAIAQRESAIRAAIAAIAQRDSELALAKKELERSRMLFERSLIAEQKLDADLTRQRSAEAALNEAQAQRETAAGAAAEARAQKEAAVAALVQEKARAQAAEAALDAAGIDVDYREAAIQAATARIERVTTDIADSTLRSPILGRVQIRVAQPGEVLAAGGRVLNLVDLSDVYMTFFLPTAAAGRVALGSEIRLVLDAVPQYVIPARASFVADVAQFTPKTVETASEREKLMFRVKAQIPEDLLRKHIAQVKTGLPGVAYVRLDPRTPWPDHLAVKLPP